MGSVAYGCNTDDSDMDIYGYAIPKLEDIFPHLRGDIPGFGTQKQNFEQYQQHGIVDGKKNYDFTIYSIIKYFQLCLDNNPNMLDSLFVPQNCVVHNTKIAQMVRENRKIFIHKGCYHKLKGYAYSQLHKMGLKNPQKGSKRAADVEKHGFDCKFAYHVIRLMDECEQLLSLGEMDLQRGKEIFKAIRRGEVSPEEITEIFNDKEKYLQKLYEESKLPWGSQEVEPQVKQLLINCLEEQYGSLEKFNFTSPDKYKIAVDKIQDIIYNLMV